MSKTYFSKEHEWIEVEGDLGTVGITSYAQEQLGDIVFAEVTKLKEKVSRNDDVAVVEQYGAWSSAVQWQHASSMSTNRNRRRRST